MGEVVDKFDIMHVVCATKSILKQFNPTAHLLHLSL